MNRIVLVLILCALNIPFLNAAKYSVVTVKGYYITRFHKNSVINFYAEKMRLVKEKSYSPVTDLESISYFIPIQIDSTFLINNESIYKAIEKYSDLHKDTIYYIPTAKYVEGYIKKVLKKRVDLSKEISLLQDVKRSHPYYMISSTDDNSMYKCVYLEGKALQIALDNTEMNRSKIDLQVDRVNPGSTQICLIFLTEINNYTPYVDIPAFEEWLPYIE